MLFFYEGNSLKSGIYEIRNRLSNKSYIGQTKEFKRRWATQWKPQLLNNKCHNKHLQNSFNFYYEMIEEHDFLEFHVLELMPNSIKEERNIREEYWIKKYIENGYNLYNNNLEPTKENKVWSHNPEETRSKQTGKNNSFYGKSHSDESKKKIKEARAKQLCSEETRKKMGLTRKGKPRSQETKEKISRAKKGRAVPEEVKKKISYALKGRIPVWKGKERTEKHKKNLSNSLKGKASWNKGRQWSSEAKLKMSLVKKGKYVGVNSPSFGKKRSQEQVLKMSKTYDVKLISPSGEIFGPITNLCGFAKTHNLSQGNILAVINGQRTHHKSWRLLKNE